MNPVAPVSKTFRPSGSFIHGMYRGRSNRAHGEAPSLQVSLAPYNPTPSRVDNVTMHTVDSESLLHHMTEGFLAVDKDGVVVTANNAAATMLQRPLSEIEGTPLTSVLPDLSGSVAEVELEKVVRGNVARRIQHFTPGRYTWFEILVYSAPGRNVHVGKKRHRPREAAGNGGRARGRSRDRA